MDGGIDNFFDPCNAAVWEPSEWGDDQDHHHDDHHENLWGILMSSVGEVSYAFESCYDTKLHILVPRS